MGSGWSWSRKAGTEDDHAAAAAEGWAEIKRRLEAEQHDLYLLDEFTYPINWGWIDLDDVLDTLASQDRPPARRHHRAPGGPPADRGRRPGHGDDQGQAPDGRRARRANGASNGDRVVALPRLVVAAPATGQGKTTIATGLMAALSRAGHEVSGHKVGPDYIDPGYHALACGRPGRNLDPHLVGEERVVPLLLHGARDADVAVIEGVMGLYDGRVGSRGFSSTAHVAALTRTPVVLVVDISRSSRSIGAVVHGMATWDPSVEVAGVILNQAGSAAARRRGPRVDLAPGARRAPPRPRPSHPLPSPRAWSPPPSAREAAAVVDRARRADRRDASTSTPSSRSLAPPPTSMPSRGRLCAWSRLASLAPQPAAPLVERERASAEPRDPAPVVAVAGGRAFTFRYAETDELLEAAGCPVVTFDPATDPALPEGTRGLYLGGGFPEVHAADLSANAPLREAIRGAVLDGPADGRRVRRAALPLPHPRRRADGRRARRRRRMIGRLTLATRRRSPPPTPCSPGPASGSPGTSSTARTVTPGCRRPPPGSIDGDAVGFASRPTLHASYLHTHWAGHPQLAQRFAEAVHAHA